MIWGAWLNGIVLGLGLLALTACVTAPLEPTVTPRTRPAGMNEVSYVPPSASSQALARRYRRVQAGLLSQGLLRVDGGGVDTYYSDTDLIRNFERIAFYNEYVRGGGLTRDGRTPGALKRWNGSVRIGVEYGSTVPVEQRLSDSAAIAGYAARLSRITGHPVSAGSGEPNFHVLIMGEDDRLNAREKARRIAPDIAPSALDFFSDTPSGTHCFVIVLGDTQAYNYTTAIAFIRAEQPDLLRRSCIHEEIAQGLGLGNDSPRARPSIFNDDDEFALLTTHDEELLRILYNPALSPGMTLEQARPLIRRIVSGRSGPI